MGYSTEAEVRESKYDTSLNNIAGTGEEGTAKIAAAIKYADGRIDYYCNSKYVVPFSPVPDYINGVSVILANLWLYRRSDVVNKAVKEAAEAVLEELKEIRDGDGTVPDLSSSSGDVEFYSPIEESKFGTGVLK